MVEALDIQVKGIVQGVGFRPFVYRLAKRYLINGWVLNAVDGVFIHAEGEGKLLDEFVCELHENPPAAAHVEEVDLKEVPLQDFETFEIRFSDEAKTQETTLVSPDLATCNDCVSELFDPADRRYRYPFINCTNCGPRFTIIDALPYDREKTSMGAFPMCGPCAHEYADPLDRRFHAQPDACFDCGPCVSFAWQSSNCAVIEGMCDATCGDVALDAVSGGIPFSESDVERVCDRSCADAERACDGNVRVVWGRGREKSDAIFARAARLLASGGIVAVKGLGGFHLACDANNKQAVAQLRQRKRREGKAFAVMMRDVQAVRQVCQVSAEEAKVLESAARPIVLLKRLPDAAFVPGLIGDLPELGVMLPCTPVQHLLLHDFCEQVAAGCAGGAAGAKAVGYVGGAASPVQVAKNPPMLVMTSGNIHDEPIVIDDTDAYDRLLGIADAVLGNNRAIRTRFDDSVVRVIRAGSAGTAIQMIRRARGYAPVPIACPVDSACCGGSSEEAGSADKRMPAASNCADVASCASLTHVEGPVVFATGPDQKCTFALARLATHGEREAEAFVSQHIGDLEHVETYDAWLAAKARFEQLFRMEPTLVACDLHPEYLSSKWAADQEPGTRIVRVQHHHAHIASVVGEHGIRDAVCGIAFDGTGYGADGRIWGGEVLVANMAAFERFANFAYVPMPGGAAAVRHPLRMAYGVLWAFDLLDHPGAARAIEQLGEQADVCAQMIDAGINTPLTSSVGRLFDAASALLGICTEPTYEGEPAILLEAALHEYERECGAPCTTAASASSVGRQTDGTISIVKNTALPNSTAQDTSVLLLDPEPAFRALLDDVVAGVPVGVIAQRFHDAFVGAIVDVAQLCRAVYGIETVALTGGVFMNRYVVEHALDQLEQAGFSVAINRDLPPNDGCVSFGQAVVALNAKEH
ncbi:carbamoyltransferase HypF [Adlercreutzia sp. ZJ141]|uniref:carbamoyltransferase HypF n=1 Tax=Adlercreutzia sp. ZJ141 TaxID=2709406 RepID=UPI0013ED2BF8|nr:carbamoyltransferase HypF [Adlercreutzia sp. ZJ141]